MSSIIRSIRRNVVKEQMRKRKLSQFCKQRNKFGEKLPSFFSMHWRDNK